MYFFSFVVSLLQRGEKRDKERERVLFNDGNFQWN
jgi:hypothetical protein